jgi:hypothetical protein
MVNAVQAVVGHVERVTQRQSTSASPSPPSRGPMFGAPRARLVASCALWLPIGQTRGRTCSQRLTSAPNAPRAYLKPLRRRPLCERDRRPRARVER